MKIAVQVVNPAGNITLLVKTPIPKESYGEVAKRLLDIPELRGEQVGFLTKPTMGGVVRLEMMGGEFCGNALRSTGFYYAGEHGIHRKKTLPVEISGYDGALQVTVNPLAGQAEGEMPLPREIQRITLLDQPCHAVVFDGIVHGILLAPPVDDGEAIRRALEHLTEEYQSAAAGVMFWQFREKKMTPVVYVRETESLFFESSCASGSTAVAAWEGLEAGDGIHPLTIVQPGGTIQTMARVKNGELTGVTIGGEVTMGLCYDVEF